jgi:YbgC/YbaW family acyl-CoA thioester hydrolase
MPFRYYLRVRYAECDAQKVVFNARYADYVDVTVNEFLRAAGVQHQFVDGNLDFQLVKQTVEWKSPARFDDVLEVSVATNHLGNTSFTLGTEFRVAGHDAVIARAETVYVLVDVTSLTKLTIPADIRVGLERGAAERVTDHAGYLTGQSSSDAFPLVDLALARRLEGAEGTSCARFAEARSKLFTGSGAAWIDVDGTYAVFDGAASPVTQTFGFGLFTTPLAAQLDRIEHFFRERSAPVHHEVCPLADPGHLSLLLERGYQPFELTSVLYQPIAGAVDAVSAPTGVRAALLDRTAPDEVEAWAHAAAQGWSENGDLGEFIQQMTRIIATRPDVHMFQVVDGGRPIATAALNVAGGVALLAGASTIPAARQRGAQLALLAARLAFAARLGCDLAMMGAAPGSASQRNAERHGFRIAYTRTKWRLPLPSRAERELPVHAA